MHALLSSLQKVQEQINSRKSLLSITTDKSQIQQLNDELEALSKKEFKHIRNRREETAKRQQHNKRHKRKV